MRAAALRERERQAAEFGEPVPAECGEAPGGRTCRGCRGANARSPANCTTSSRTPISVMVLQVGAVRHRLPETDWPRTRHALGRVEAGRPHGTRRDAPPAGSDAPRRVTASTSTPQPGLDGLDALLADDVRGAQGFPVQLQLRRRSPPAPARDRPLRLPDRAGRRSPTRSSTHRRAQADVTVRYRPTPRGARGPRRRQERRVERRRSATGSSASASGSRSTAARHVSRGLATDGGFVLSARAAGRKDAAMSIRVLVADDQSMVRAGFRMLLSGEAGHRGRRRGKQRSRGSRQDRALLDQPWY